MIIKKINQSLNDRDKKRCGLLKRKSGFIFRSFILLMTLLVGVVAGIYINNSKIVKSLPTIKQDLLYFFGGELLTDIKNYYKGQNAQPEELIIDIKQIDYDRLAYNRSIALQRGVLLTDIRDEVPAVITWNGKQYKVKLRLKGDLPDHWADEKKWSFRISVDGDNAIMGMKNFSIQAPETRGMLNEWMYHKFLRYNDLIAIRYDFISVKLNGSNLGIYALEEFFEKRLIENNQRREGPVFRFDESMFMPLLMVKPTDIANIPSFYKEGFSVAQLDAFQSNRVLKDSVSLKRFLTAKNLMESFRKGKLKTSEVFDVPKLALFFAVNDLFGQWGFGGHHTIEYRNIRFYFNPFNGKIEPIGFDNGYIWYTSENGLQVENPENYEWINLFFADSEFVDQYIKALDFVSEKNYLDNFFAAVAAEMNQKLAVLYKHSPKYRFYGKPILYENQKYIKTILNHPAVMNVHFVKHEGNKLTLKVGNRQWMPLEITELTYNNNIKYKPIAKTILPSKKAHELVQYTEVVFEVPPAMQWSPEDIAMLVLKAKTKSLPNEFVSLVKPWNDNDWSGKKVEFNLNPSVLSEFEFLTIEEKTRTVLIKPGKHIIKRNLVVPPGYTMHAGEGTIIDIQNNANFISYSPVRFIGLADNPIAFISSDSTGQGFAVLSPGGLSYLEHVVFDNLANHNQGSWVLTGCVTFYEADAIVKHCNFINNRSGDDILNFVRCKMWVDNCKFIGAKADALDGDFVNGVITNSYFKNSGNDALDFSGSVLNIKNIVIENSGDKGISMGEASYARADNIKIIGGEIAVAAKDLAQLRIKNLTISNSKLGFTVYRKKPEFGYGYIMVTDFTGYNIERLHLVEAGSYLVINSSIIKPDMPDVKDILYGIEYGKASAR